MSSQPNHKQFSIDTRCHFLPAVDFIVLIQTHVDSFSHDDDDDDGGVGGVVGGVGVGGLTSYYHLAGRESGLAVSQANTYQLVKGARCTVCTGLHR